jgi:hypothetical protein
VLLPAAACRRQGPAPHGARLDAALERAIGYLVAEQDADGGWRSKVYGDLRDGATLAGPILKLLYLAPVRSAPARAAFRRGTDHLVSWIGPDGRVRAGELSPGFPVYAAALASVVVDLEDPSADHRRAQRAWLDLVDSLRLGRELGWRPEDPVLGGWGYAAHPPRKEPGGIAYEANLSATLFGLLALRHAEVPRGDPRYAEIRAFVARCQNFAASPADADPGHDDGGFFFTPGDAARNKAGPAGRDRLGRERFHSYGSATADGIRALLRSGFPRDAARVAAARAWLESRFSASTNPGRFEPDREVLRDATYYYYAWSAAHAFVALGLGSGSPPAAWAAELSEELMRRQLPDGSWRNRWSDAKEDDPLVATPLAAAALAICRAVLAGSGLPEGPRFSRPGGDRRGARTPSTYTKPPVSRREAMKAPSASSRRRSREQPELQRTYSGDASEVVVKGNDRGAVPQRDPCNQQVHRGGQEPGSEALLPKSARILP